LAGAPPSCLVRPKNGADGTFSKLPTPLQSTLQNGCAPSPARAMVNSQSVSPVDRHHGHFISASRVLGSHHAFHGAAYTGFGVTNALFRTMIRPATTGWLRRAFSQTFRSRKIVFTQFRQKACPRSKRRRTIKRSCNAFTATSGLVSVNPFST